MKDFWEIVEEQLTELRTASTADEVISILSHDRNPLGPSTVGDGHFAGSGGDGSVMGSLTEAGWDVRWAEAHYHWCMRAPNGDDMITYVEGDIYRGNQRPLPHGAGEEESG